MKLAMPDRTLLENHITDVDIHGDPEPWQVEIGKNVGSTIVWWDVGQGEDDLALHVGTVEPKQSDDPRESWVQPIRFEKALVPTVLIIGAADFGPQIEWLTYLDGRNLDDGEDVAATLKNDRAWVIPTVQNDELITCFHPHRWRTLTESARKAEQGGEGLSRSTMLMRG